MNYLRMLLSLIHLIMLTLQPKGTLLDAGFVGDPLVSVFRKFQSRTRYISVAGWLPHAQRHTSGLTFSFLLLFSRDTFAISPSLLCCFSLYEPDHAFWHDFLPLSDRWSFSHNLHTCSDKAVQTFWGVCRACQVRRFYFRPLWSEVEGHVPRVDFDYQQSTGIGNRVTYHWRTD